MGASRDPSVPRPASPLGATERGIVSKNQRLLLTGTPLPTRDPVLQEGQQPRSHPVSPRSPRSSSEVPVLTATSVTSLQASAAGLPGGLGLRLRHRKAQTRLRQPGRNHTAPLSEALRGPQPLPFTCHRKRRRTQNGNFAAAGPKISASVQAARRPLGFGEGRVCRGAWRCAAGHSSSMRHCHELGTGQERTQLPGDLRTPAACRAPTHSVPPVVGLGAVPCPPGCLTALPPAGLGLSEARGRVQGGSSHRMPGPLLPFCRPNPLPQILSIQRVRGEPRGCTSAPSCSQLSPKPSSCQSGLPGPCSIPGVPEPPAASPLKQI